jgi:hypothetical protein
VVDSYGSTVHPLSPFWSQAFHVLKGSLSRSEFAHLYKHVRHPTARLKEKPCIRIAFLHLYIITHCTPRSVFGYRRTSVWAQSCRRYYRHPSRSCYQLTITTYHVSSTRLARVPLPRVAFHGTEAKAKLQSPRVRNYSWHSRDLGQSWTTPHRSSPAQHKPYYLDTPIVRQQGKHTQVSTLF